MPQITHDSEPDPDGLIPVGGVIMHGAASAPTDWLLCDGSAVSQTTYAGLYDVIGTTYGNPGGGNFNLPDLRQRFPLGKAASGTGSTLAGTGGNVDHDHDGSSYTSAASTNLIQSVSGSAPRSKHAHTHAGSGNVGTANPPFLVVNYIVRT